MNKKLKMVSLILAGIILVVLGVLFGFKFFEKGENNISSSFFKGQDTLKYTGPKIFNMQSEQRPVAVMLDNNKDAWPHSNINEAYLVYEIEVEGGESRLMALFKDKKNANLTVGPIRSARHYFLDYALENDAIYAHVGQSPKAESDIKSLNVADINGQNYDTLKPENKNNEKEFYRSKDKNRPHNSYTKIGNIFNIANSLNYSTKSKSTPAFKYSKEEVNLNEEKSDVATIVTAQYHSGNKTVFEYNKEKKEYTRTAKKKLQVDEKTKEEHTIKNLIVLQAKITDLKDKEDKGRKDVKTVDTMNGYFVTNGRSIKITAIKDARNKKTVYKDIDGNEIEVNDGRTYVMIVPNNEKITIE